MYTIAWQFPVAEPGMERPAVSRSLGAKNWRTVPPEQKEGSRFQPLLTSALFKSAMNVPVTVIIHDVTNTSDIVKERSRFQPKLTSALFKSVMNVPVTMIIHDVTNASEIVKERSSFQPMLTSALFKSAVNVINTSDIDTTAPRIIITVRIRIKPVVTRSCNSLKDFDCHICNHSGTASKISGRYCCCGKCSLVALFENTCPQAYGALTPFLQSTTLMSFYSSNFLLPADNWWKILDDSALLPLGGPAILPGLPVCIPSQHASTACGGKQCFRLRRAWASTPLQGEVSNNIDTFRGRKGTLKTCFNSVKQFRHPHTRLLDSKFSTKWKKGTSTTDPKGLANLTLLLLIIAGDVELNPGPESGN